MMKQAKKVRIICRGEPECQGGDIEVHPLHSELGSGINYEFAGVNDFQDTMESIKVRYEVVEEVWA